VYRELQLGGTLKSSEDGYLLDLSLPGQHKTSSAFGPTCTPVPPRVTASIAALVSVGGPLTDGDYLFHGDERTTALPPFAFSRLVKAAFKAYGGGVAMCPKDVRAAYITFLRDGYDEGEHDDAVLASAAKAMRHSSAMQQSVHYDKHKAKRTVSAAMSVADAFASRYTL